jgi:hypothetical protein
MRSLLIPLTLSALATWMSGCSPAAKDNLPASAAIPPTDPAPQADAPHTHLHEREHMLIADAGAYHVLLTAHLSKDGNELDIFIETPVTENPQPVAVPLKSFTAQATVGDGEAQTLTFEPAPAEERPAGEGDDTCSHFVAKAGWMKPNDTLYVVARLPLDGQELAARWENFVPSKFAHHQD